MAVIMAARIAPVAPRTLSASTTGQNAARMPTLKKVNICSTFLRVRGDVIRRPQFAEKRRSNGAPGVA